jgi:GNAT superfamily N-acetyltransferase
MRRTIAVNPSIRILVPEEWSTYRDLRLQALADSPDAFGRTLAEEKDRPDTEWLNRLVSGADIRWNLPLLAEAGGEPVGLAWGRIERSSPEVANLYQMWVAPEYRGMGVGQMLLEAVIAWARESNLHQLALGVTCGDTPAMRLYTRAGFKPVGQPQPLRPESDLLGQQMVLVLRADAA